MERENPYVGFRPFLTRDALYFFGRDEQTRALLQNLRRFRFVSVVGNSGSGKSSLVLAGLIPALRGGFLGSARDAWVIASLRPGDAPLENLAQALVEACGPAMAGVSREALAADIRARGVPAVTDVLAQRPNGTNVLLLADQFEELFAFMAAAGSELGDPPGRAPDHAVVEERIRRQADAQTFVSVLMAVAAAPDTHAYVITTMRTDFLGDCDRFPGLPELINQAGYLVPRMTREALRDAMEGPASLAGVPITPRLRDLVLNEIGDKPDLLPLLQHALHRAWRVRAHGEEPGSLDLSHLERIGGLRRALSSEADALIADFDERLVAAVFRRLTRVDSGRRRVRRACSLSELLAVAPAPREQVVALLDRLSADGTNLLYKTRGVHEDDPRLDISHESLIRQWERLQRWMDEERELARLYAELCEKAARWRDGGELSDPSPAARRLLRDLEARQVTEVWAARYASEMPATWAEVQRYVAQLRRQQRRRRVAWSMGAAALLALVMAFTWRQRQERAWSEQQAQLAALAALADTDPTQAVWVASQWGESQYTDPVAMAVLDQLEQRFTAVAEFTNVALYEPLGDGERVAIATSDGRVQIVSSTGEGSAITAFGRDGRMVVDLMPLADHSLLVAMNDGEVLHWHYDGPRAHAHPVDTVRDVRSMRVLAGGRRVLLGASGGRAYVFGTGARESWRALARPMAVLAVSPSDSSMVALYERAPGGASGSVLQYDVDADSVVSRWRVADTARTTVLAAFAADGRTLLVASATGAHPLELIDRRGRLLERFPSPDNVAGVSAAGSGDEFLLTDYDGNVRLVGATVREDDAMVTRHASAARALRVPTQPWVLSSDDDGDAQVTWVGRGTTPSARNGYTIPLLGHSRGVGMLDIRATTRALFTRDANGLLRVWFVAGLAPFEPAGIGPTDDGFRVMADVAGVPLRTDPDVPWLTLDGHRLRAPTDSTAVLYPLAMAADGHAAAACAGRGRCWVWTSTAARLDVARPIAHPTVGPSDTAVFTADGSTLFVQRGADSLVEVSVSTGAVGWRSGIDHGAPWSVSRNGRVLVFERGDTVRAVRLDDPQRAVRVLDTSPGSVWRWSPRNARLAVVAGDTLRLFAFADSGGTTTRTLRFSATDSLFDHQIDAEGEWFAVLRGDQSVSVYRVGAGEALVQQLRLPRPRSRLMYLRFLPWGHGLLAGTADGNAELWQWRERCLLEDSLARPSWGAWMRPRDGASANGDYVLVRRALIHHPSVSAAYEDNASFVALDGREHRVTLLVQPSWAAAKRSSWYLDGARRRARFVARAPKCLDRSAIEILAGGLSGYPDGCAVR